MGKVLPERVCVCVCARASVCVCRTEVHIFDANNFLAQHLGLLTHARPGMTLHLLT